MGRPRTSARKARARPEAPRAAVEGPRPAPEGARRPLAATPVFDSLAGAILRGKFPPGASLPPERELAALFNVSRLIVRQALHRLREIGLVHGGQGGQTTVLDPDASSDPRIIQLTMQLAPKASDERDVMARQLVGAAMLLELAARGIAPAQIDALEKHLDDFAARASGGAPLGEEEMSAFESAWWLAIAGATNNRILLRETRFWFDIVKEQPSRYTHLYGAQHLDVRLSLYRAVIGRLREKEDVTAFYLNAVRPLLDAGPDAL